MGHNADRSAQPASPGAQRDVDQYKSRSIWGAWRALDAQVRQRYFNPDEIVWLNRYGSRLDQLSCLSAESRNEREKHFVGTCLHHHAPKTDRERLWLRAQMVVRYEASLARAARCTEAERLVAVLGDRCKQLGADLEDCEFEVMSSYPRQWDLENRERDVVDKLRWLALRNVARAPPWMFPHTDADPRLYAVIGRLPVC